MTETARPSPDLDTLATTNGIATSYTDAMGNTRTASEPALLAALGSLGVNIESPADAGRILEARQREIWSFSSQPVVVAWDGEPSALELRTPAEASGVIDCSLTLEEGSTQAWSLDLNSLPLVEERRIGNDAYVSRALTLPQLPLGYHRLILSGAITSDVLVIGAPRRAYEHEDGRKRWGVFLPLYALHTRHSRGVGDFTDLEALADWTHEAGGQLVATLPLLPAFLGDEPFDPSPYSPVSRLFWNELYVDPARSPDLASSPEARALLANEANTSAGDGLIDYKQVAAQRRSIVSALAEAAFEQRGGVIERYVASNPDVENYARFRAVQERQRASWREWPDRLQEGEFRADDYDATVYRYFVYAQYLADEQLGSMANRLRERGQDFYLDLPLGCHVDGYDAWRFRDVFVNASAGAPPDVVFTSGQDWGLPPLHPQLLRATGYDYFRRVVAHHLTYANVLRIDHVMGLHRLFWIPAGVSAREGVYVHYHADELWAILTLESHRHQATLVGENLGTVPPAVNEAMAAHNIYESYVIQYEVSPSEGQTLRPPPGGSFASFGTHDMPPFAAYWQEDDIGERLRIEQVKPDDEANERQARRRQRTNLIATLRDAGLLADDTSPEAILAAVLRFLRRSEARYVLINLEDLWLETRAQNIPGTAEGHPNWRRRARFNLEDLPASVRNILDATS